MAVYNKDGKLRKRMGRPKILIDQSQFEKLCSIMCTLEESAGFLNCSADTIERWCKDTYGQTFADVFKSKCSPGKVSLRRRQFEEAMKGNTALLIWLGKQHLGQSDKQEIRQDITQTEVVYESEWGSLVTPTNKET